MKSYLKEFKNIKKKTIRTYARILSELRIASKNLLEERKNFKKELGLIGRGDTPEAKEIFTKWDSNKDKARVIDVDIKFFKKAIKNMNTFIAKNYDSTERESHA